MLFNSGAVPHTIQEQTENSSKEYSTGYVKPYRCYIESNGTVSQALLIFLILIKNGEESEISFQHIVHNWRNMPDNIIVTRLRDMITRQTSEIKQLKEQIMDQEQKIMSYHQQFCAVKSLSP